ncbi:MAG: hypothetical protein NUV72_08555 [Bauldia sp.]|nr:hypothetical protein [Bauldia sp.]
MKVYAGMEVRCCGQRAKVDRVRDTTSGVLVDLTYATGWPGIEVTVSEAVLEPLDALPRPSWLRPVAVPPEKGSE